MTAFDAELEALERAEHGASEIPTTERGANAEITGGGDDPCKGKRATLSPGTSAPVDGPRAVGSASRAQSRVLPPSAEPSGTGSVAEGHEYPVAVAVAARQETAFSQGRQSGDVKTPMLAAEPQGSAAVGDPAQSVTLGNAGPPRPARLGGRVRPRISIVDADGKPLL